MPHGGIGYGASFVNYLQYAAPWFGGKPENTYSYYFSSPSYISNLPQVSVVVKIPQVKWDAYYNSIYATTAGNGFTFIGSARPSIFTLPLYAAEAISDYLAYQLMSIAVDPDSSYNVPVYLKFIPVPEIETLSESSGKEVSKQLLVLSIDTEAFKEAWAKYLGARISGDEVWTRRQLATASYYASLAEEDVQNLKSKIETLIRDLHEANVTISETDVIASREQIAREGLPQREVDILRRFGFGESEIEATKNLTLSVRQEDAINLTVNYNKTLIELIEGYLAFTHDIKNQLDQQVRASFVPAKINIDPNTLNLKDGGKWVTAYIAIQGYDVSKINLSSVFLNGIVQAETNPKYGFVKNPEISDRDGDGLPELMVKFDRAEVLKILREGNVTLAVIGEVDGKPFIGRYTVKVVG